MRPVVARVGLSTSRVVDVAIAELDAVGGPPLSLSAVAVRAGVRTPSLYKHVGSLAELESRVAERVLQQLSTHVRDVIGRHQGEAAARAVLQAYRSFARAHPARYAALPVQPLADPRLAPCGRELMVAIGAALAGRDGDGSADGADVDTVLDAPTVHAMRLLRSVADGWVRLELAGGFGMPVDVEASWAALVDAVAPVAVAEFATPR